MVILIVGAHPDDIELGVGATIHKLRNRHEFHGLILSSGELRAAAENREQATIVSANTLGFCPHFARLKDRAFTDSEVEKVVGAKIEGIRPHMVIAHSKNENHRDHVAAHTGTISAARKVRNILFFESPYTSTFSPGLYIIVQEEDVVAKVSALSNHGKHMASGIPYYLNDENIRLLARTRALYVAELYAEALEIDRLVDMVL